MNILTPLNALFCSHCREWLKEGEEKKTPGPKLYLSRNVAFFLTFLICSCCIALIVQTSGRQTFFDRWGHCGSYNFTQGAGVGAGVGAHRWSSFVDQLHRRKVYHGIRSLELFNITKPVERAQYSHFLSCLCNPHDLFGQSEWFWRQSLQTQPIRKNEHHWLDLSLTSMTKILYLQNLQQKKCNELSFRSQSLSQLFQSRLFFGLVYGETAFFGIQYFFAATPQVTAGEKSVFHHIDSPVSTSGNMSIHRICRKHVF